MTVFDLVVILLIASAVQDGHGSELEVAMREHGVESVKEVNLAVPETDGSISIVPKSAPVLHTRKHIRQFRKH